MNVSCGSWVCENVGQARELPFRLNCEIFGVNEINGLEGQELRASSRFAQETGKIGVSTQSGSNCDLQQRLALRLECDGERMGWMAPAPPGVSMRHNAGVIIC